MVKSGGTASLIHKADALPLVLTAFTRRFGNIAVLPILTDVDDAADLPALVQALDALPDPLPAQRALRDWLHGASGRSSVTAMHA